VAKCKGHVLRSWNENFEPGIRHKICQFETRSVFKTKEKTIYFFKCSLGTVFSANTNAESFWTSGMGLGCDTKFTWCVGEKAKPLLRPNWAPGEPSGAAAQNCLALSASSSLAQIISKDCTTSIRFICEVEPLILYQKYIPE
jgi:hypothetical protein